MTYRFRPREIGSVAAIGGPEWILVGCDVSTDQKCRERGYHVMVLASSSLTEVELRAISHDLGPEAPWELLSRHVFSPPVYTLTAVMETQRADGGAVLWIAYGATYAEALAKVMGQWNPDERRAPQIDGQKQLDRVGDDERQAR